MLQEEIAIMKKLNHPNVLQLHEVIDDPKNKKLYMILDYIDGGFLGSKTHLKKLSMDQKKRKLPLSKIWRYFREVVQGLHYRKYPSSDC